MSIKFCVILNDCISKVFFVRLNSKIRNYKRDDILISDQFAEIYSIYEVK